MWRRRFCAATPTAWSFPFDLQAFDAKVDPSDSILSLADRLAKYGGGGTDCSLPLRQANTALRQKKFAGVVLVSDNESWVYAGRPYYGGPEWCHGRDDRVEAVRSEPGLGCMVKEYTGPKLICIDLQSYVTTQAPERSDILNVGGFSDAVFDVITAFLSGDAGRFVSEVEGVTV